MTRIFISHSHSDEAIAHKLVNFLLAALKLDEEDILCTSNPDQGLSFSSSSITDQLKKQLKNSEALIILITADSLHSAWIPFEAGSFWTTDKPIIPILGTGLSQNNLPGPLRSFLSISIETNDSEDKLNNAIIQLAQGLNIEQKYTKRRNDTLTEFSRELKAWKSRFAKSDTSQQEQDDLEKAIELCRGINSPRPVALILSLTPHTGSIKSVVEDFLVANQWSMEIEEVNFDGISPENIEYFYQAIRNKKRELDEKGYTEIHLFLSGPVQAGTILGCLFCNWKPVKLYHKVQGGSYEYWMPLIKL